MMLQTQGWRGSAGRQGPGEDFTGTNQPKFVQTEGHQHVLTAGTRRASRGSQLQSLCTGLQEAHVRSPSSAPLQAHLVPLSQQRWCEMLSGKCTLSAQSHGWGWADIWAVIFMLLFSGSGAGRDTLQN